MKVIAAILALAKSMDIEVTAEGIETVVQRDWLRQAGCHFGQGFYFGHAMPQEEIA
jgi:sensor c-di-GMP phosphodiesterase-like protein